MAPTLVILLLIVINGIFVMAEMALVSSRKPRLQQLANEGDGGAQVAGVGCHADSLTHRRSPCPG